MTHGNPAAHTRTESDDVVHTSPGSPNGPLVTVVTPTFNSARYLRWTLESVARQDYPRLEHIIVDGGSSDETLRIVGEFPRVRCLSGPDNGMYDAINKGLRAAKGEIQAYLNSDDLYFPDTVPRIVDYFASHPSTELVFGNCRYIDESGETLFVRRYPDFNWRLFSVLDGSTVPQQTCFWRSSLVSRVGPFNTSFSMAGDFEFLVRAGKVSTFGRIGGRPLAQFRFHQGMQTLTRGEVNEREIDRIHMMHPVTPAWSVPILRAAATLRYRSRNLHRAIDKLTDRLRGKPITYRP